MSLKQGKYYIRWSGTKLTLIFAKKKTYPWTSKFLPQITLSVHLQKLSKWDFIEVSSLWNNKIEQLKP